LEGERKQVTVLFADLKGSMELLADRDPEEARKLLDPVLQRMMEAVHHYEGTVNQVMGDGIMALFGAPVAHEDHAVRACYAALRMQASVKRHAADLRRLEGIPLRIRVGLNSGEVVVRSIGNDLHMDYTAVGQTTHLAARMEQLAAPESIVIAPATLALVEGFVQVTPLGPVPVKGLADPVEIYEVTGPGPAQTRLQASVRRGLTPFVGRDAELELLRRAQQRAGKGHGQVVAIVGEAGSGKSRVVYEFTHSPSMQGWRLLESAAVSYEQKTSYLPMINLLKDYFEIRDRDDPGTIRENVRAKLLALDRGLEAALPALLTLLDMPADDRTWSTLDPGPRRQRTFDAVKRVLLRETREHPVVLTVEDLHWTDGETQALLDSLVESLGSARLLLLVTYRPEYQHGWGGKAAYSQTRVGTLPAERAKEFLEALLGDDDGLAPLKQLLVKRGNPFFLEEIVRTLVETKMLAGERGRYRPLQVIDRIQIPSTVHAMLEARMDRLPAEGKHLLQMAAVIGTHVPIALLEAIADLGEELLRASLAHLQSAEFLYEATVFPDVEFRFTHALTQEVAYGTLLQDARHELHARVLTALEEGDRGHFRERLEILAHHAVRGEQWAPAARYLYLGGEKAIAGARYEAAIEFHEAAVGAIDRLGHQGDSYLKLDAYLGLWASLVETGRGSQLSALATRAETLARALGDHGRLAGVRLRQAQAFSLLGLNVESAIQRADEAFALADVADVRTRSFALTVKGGFYRELGRVEDSLQVFDAAAALLADQSRSSPTAGLVLPIYVTARVRQTEALAALGRFDVALGAAGDAVRMATEIEHLPSAAIAEAILGHVHVLRGDLERSVPILERASAIGLEHGFIHGVVAGAVYLAHALALLGRHDEALATLGQALERSRDGYLYLMMWTKYRALSAAVFLAAGHDDEAKTEIENGLSLVSEHHAWAYEPTLRRLQASLLLHRDPTHLEEAVHILKDAEVRAKTMELRPLVAHCHHDLAKLYRRAGRREPAREHFNTATTMYREMDMAFWLQEAESHVRALG